MYAKQPFGGPKQVVEYLGRYSHKIAISNHRIKNVSEGKVSFSYKDYADGSKQKLMTLDAEEFLRRFCLHILPPKFMKIRHCGLLANRNKEKLRKLQFGFGIIKPKLSKLEKQKHWKEIAKTKLHFDVDACACCKIGVMIRVSSFDANAPPNLLQHYKNKQENP